MFIGMGFWAGESTDPAAFVTPALVQKGTGNTTANGGTTATVTLPNAVAGHKIIVTTAASQSDRGTTVATPTSVSAGAATSPFVNNAVGEFSVSTDTEGHQVSIWSADITVSGTLTVTVTWPNSGNWAQVTVSEWSGVASGAAIDQLAYSSGHTTAGQKAAGVGPTGATGFPKELVIAVFGAGGFTNNALISTPATSGYANLGFDQDATSICAYSADSKVASAVGAQSASWDTIDDLAGDWSAAIATFKAKAA